MTSGMQANIPLKAGDHVIINIEDIDMIKQIQANHGGWKDAMKECLVRPCRVIHLIGVNAVVKAPSGNTYHLHSKLLRKYNKHDESLSRYSVGDIVEVINDNNRVKVLQKGHGEWHELMNLILKKKGTVKSIHPNGDLQVEMKGTEIRLNPECVMKVRWDKYDSLFTEMSSLLYDETVSDSGDTPLHVAVRKKNYLLCCQLVEGGAHVNALNKKGMTPMMLAAQIGCGDVLSLLAQQKDARLDTGDVYNNTALHLAVQNSNDDAVRILLEAGANIKAVNNKQFTPFHLAALCGHEKILELFLDNNDRSLVDLRQDDNWTALHVAARNNHTDYLRLLIRHKADLNIRNNIMQTALHIAVSQRYMDCTKILVESEAELNLQDGNGDTPLHYAIQKTEMTRVGSSKIRNNKPQDIAIYLVKHGASLKILNSAGKSPLTACDDTVLREKLRNLQAEGRSCQVPVPESGFVTTEQLMIQNEPDEIMCHCCLENRVNIIFNCGHRTCNDCANNIRECPMCHQEIEMRIRIN